MPVEPLLKVLAVIRQTDPALFERVSVEHVGRVDSHCLEGQLKKFDMAANFTSHGYQSRSRSTEILSKASLMYFGLASGKEEGIVPGRVFDLFASGRPMLAAVSQGGELGRMILSTENGGCFYGDNDQDIERAAEYVTTLERLSDSEDLGIECLPRYARQYSTENMAGAFARIIRSLPS